MTSGPSTSDASAELEALLASWIETANTEFEKLCGTRHAKGQEEYGATTFLAAPTIDMAMEEAADLSNYSRYTYIKLWILKRHTEMLEEQYREKEAMSSNTGVGFVPLHKFMGPS